MQQVSSATSVTGLHLFIRAVADNLPGTVSALSFSPPVQTAGAPAIVAASVQQRIAPITQAINTGNARLVLEKLPTLTPEDIDALSKTSAKSNYSFLLDGNRTKDPKSLAKLYVLGMKIGVNPGEEPVRNLAIRINKEGRDLESFVLYGDLFLEAVKKDFIKNSGIAVNAALRILSNPRRNEGETDPGVLPFRATKAAEIARAILENEKKGINFRLDDSNTIDLLIQNFRNTPELYPLALSVLEKSFGSKLYPVQLVTINHTLSNLSSQSPKLDDDFCEQVYNVTHETFAFFHPIDQRPRQRQAGFNIENFNFCTMHMIESKDPVPKLWATEMALNISAHSYIERGQTKKFVLNQATLERMFAFTESAKLDDKGSADFITERRLLLLKLICENFSLQSLSNIRPHQMLRSLIDADELSQTGDNRFDSLLTRASLDNVIHFVNESDKTSFEGFLVDLERVRVRRYGS